VLLILTYWVLTKVVFPNRLGDFEGAKTLIAEQIAALGRIGKAEHRTLLVFVGTALAWIFRNQLNQLVGLDKAAGDIVLSDEMIAIFATLVLFLIPVDWRKSQFLLAWEDTQRLPWGILLLFGGGLSLADALKHVGWIDLIGEEFATVQSSGFVIILGLTAVSLFLTEVMSNVALVTVFLPVVGAIAVGMGLNPVLFCIPVTLAASCAFMLPMGTPPNAIVFASGHLRMADMVKAGLWLNLIAIVLIAILTQWVLPGLV
jgi:sodium-dependent dicarboxylate transporter 2/3/5